MAANRRLEWRSEAGVNTIGGFSEEPGRRRHSQGIISSVTDRSKWPTRKLALEDEAKYNDTASLSPAQRIEMVWEITRDAWTFKDPNFRESRLRRDIARVIRRQS